MFGDAILVAPKLDDYYMIGGAYDGEGEEHWWDIFAKILRGFKHEDDTIHFYLPPENDWYYYYSKTL